MSQTITDQIRKATSLVDGLEANIQVARNYGIDSLFIDQLKEQCEQLTAFEAERDELKAELARRTKSANNRLARLRTDVQKVKRTIKSNQPKEEWIKFGIADKQ